MFNSFFVFSYTHKIQKSHFCIQLQISFSSSTDEPDEFFFQESLINHKKNFDG
jgi:hypothetical protein